MQATLTGPWDARAIENFLTSSAIPLRLSCVGSDGFPRVVSVWFEYRDDCLHCVSHRNSSLVRLLRQGPRVGFEVSPNDPPYFGVRGQGVARLSKSGVSEQLETLLQRYLGAGESRLATWLRSRVSEELRISIEPTRLFSWDYRRRMSDIQSGPER